MQKPGAMKVKNFRKQYKDYLSTLKSSTEEEKSESTSNSVTVALKDNENDNKNEQQSKQRNENKEVITLLEVMNEQMKIMQGLISMLCTQYLAE